MREQKLRKLGEAKSINDITAAFSVELAGQDEMVVDVDNLQETMDRSSIRHQRQPTSRYMLNQRQAGLGVSLSIIQAGDGGARPSIKPRFLKLFVARLFAYGYKDLSDPEIVRTYYLS